MFFIYVVFPPIMNIAFGPVPSRRLGMSLGVNNIPDKVCSYSCVYCQIGNTLRMSMKREKFYEPEIIYREVEKKVREPKKIDYITFVPDGEPTLDINLGKEIEILKNLGIKIAVLTNSSLIWHDDVRDELLNLDFVSLKIDAVSSDLWRKIDRPHKDLKIEKILNGMLEFRDEFGGKVVTETMLIDGINYHGEFENIADFLGELKPDIAYIAIPTRPPAEKWVKPANEIVINHAYQIFSQKVKKVEYLIGYEGNEFSASGNFEKDIMDITAVHPMREDAVRELLKNCNEKEETLKKMISEGKIMAVEYRGKKYYMRSLPSRKYMGKY